MSELERLKEDVIKRINVFGELPNHQYNMVNRVDEDRKKRLLHVESRLETNIYYNTEYLKTLKKKDDLF